MSVTKEYTILTGYTKLVQCCKLFHVLSPSKYFRPQSMVPSSEVHPEVRGQITHGTLQIELFSLVPSHRQR